MENRPAQPPEGEIYDWYHRGLELIEGGHAHAAAQILGHARTQAPESTSIREALARALFDARRYDEAEAAFREQLTNKPDDDYARFGLGLALSRRGEFVAAAEHLALAVTMRPDRSAYVDALRQVRATLRAREERDAVRETQVDGSVVGSGADGFGANGSGDDGSGMTAQG